MLFRSDRKSTRLNSSHLVISYAVFCLKKKTKQHTTSNDTKPHSFHSSGQHKLQRDAQRRPQSLLTLRPRYSHKGLSFFFFFFNDTATTEIYTLSLHDALPI